VTGSVVDDGTAMPHHKLWCDYVLKLPNGLEKVTNASFEGPCTVDWHALLVTVRPIRASLHSAGFLKLPVLLVDSKRIAFAGMLIRSIESGLFGRMGRFHTAVFVDHPTPLKVLPVVSWKHAVGCHG